MNLDQTYDQMLAKISESIKISFKEKTKSGKTLLKDENIIKLIQTKRKIFKLNKQTNDRFYEIYGFILYEKIEKELVKLHIMKY